MNWYNGGVRNAIFRRKLVASAAPILESLRFTTQPARRRVEIERNTSCETKGMNMEEFIAMILEA